MSSIAASEGEYPKPRQRARFFIVAHYPQPKNRALPICERQAFLPHTRRPYVNKGGMPHAFLLRRGRLVFSTEWTFFDRCLDPYSVLQRLYEDLGEVTIRGTEPRKYAQTFILPVVLCFSGALSALEAPTNTGLTQWCKQLRFMERSSSCEDGFFLWGFSRLAMC